MFLATLGVTTLSEPATADRTVSSLFAAGLTCPVASAIESVPTVTVGVVPPEAIANVVVLSANSLLVQVTLLVPMKNFISSIAEELIGQLRSREEAAVIAVAPISKRKLATTTVPAVFSSGAPVLSVASLTTKPPAFSVAEAESPMVIALLASAPMALLLVSLLSADTVDVVAEKVPNTVILTAEFAASPPVPPKLTVASGVVALHAVPLSETQEVPESSGKFPRVMFPKLAFSVPFWGIADTQVKVKSK